MPRVNEGDQRPLGSLAGSQQVTSGAALAQVGHRLVICFSVTGNLSLTTLDGVTTTLSSMPVGVFSFDCQHTLVAWTGTATAVSFYRP